MERNTKMQKVVTYAKKSSMTLVMRMKTTVGSVITVVTQVRGYA